jgi:alkylhydroperoxidase/carboxymuconolactone decarboxylase family protein YurZ
MAFYSGWPTALTAAAIAKDVFAKRDEAEDQDND